MYRPTQRHASARSSGSTRQGTMTAPPAAAPAWRCRCLPPC